MASQESPGLNDRHRIGFRFAVQDEKSGENDRQYMKKAGELQRGAFRVQFTCFPYKYMCFFILRLQLLQPFFLRPFSAFWFRE